MKVIELLNKIANGEADEMAMIKFANGDYCNIRIFFDRYIMDRENLNLDIQVDNKIEKIPKKNENGDVYLYSNEALEIIDKINEIIDKIQE